MLILMWWLIPIGAAAVATWWVYAIAPSDTRDPDRPKSRRELERMRSALGRPLPAKRVTADAQPPAVIDLTDSSPDKSDSQRD